MTYDECMSLIDFLNDRLRAFNSPWYTWAVKIDWDKLKRWGGLLGYEFPT